MAISAQIAKVSNKHEMLLQYMIANPTAGLRELSAAFQMTVPWISVIINSDAFQAKLAERQDEVFSAAVVPLRQKLEGVAYAAVDKLGRQLEVVHDPKLVLDIADKTLHRLGYAPSRSPAAGAAVQQNNTQINLYGRADPQTVQEARELMKQRTTSAPALEHVADGSEGTD